MGCSSAKERIVNKMLTLKLQKFLLNEERERRCKDYKHLTGNKIEKKEIPDYIEQNEKNKKNKKNKKSNNKDDNVENEDDNKENEDNNLMDNNNENKINYLEKNNDN